MNEFNPQIYWEERLKKSVGLQGVGYTGMGESYNVWLYKVRRRVFLRIIRFLGMGLMKANVIDIGSGTGFYIERWKELGVRNIVGTDLTWVSIEKLQRKFPGGRFYQIDIGSNTLTPLELGQYDVVSAFDVLFHIVDDQRYQTAIQNIYALLRLGGWFIFSDNFLHHGTERAQHQVSRSLRDISDMLEHTGFRIIRRIPMFVLMNDPIDQTNHFVRCAWQTMLARIRRVSLLGFIVGACLFPLELLLTRSLEESPTTEIMVCRKPG